MKSVVDETVLGRGRESVRETVEIAVSVVVPVTERPASLTELYREYSSPLRDSKKSYEFIFVAEPWFERLTAEISELALTGEPIRVFRSHQTIGETALVRLAAKQCRGEIVVTLPAYPRVEASALPALIARVEAGVHVAVARRWPRRDSWINRLQTRAFHALVGRLAGEKLHDVACGVRAIRRDVLLELPLHGDSVRFLPLFALREGFEVEEVPTPQHDRDRRTRVYRPGVYLRRLIDVLGLFFLLRFMEKPLRFFGLAGSVVSLTGAGVLFVLLIQRIGGQGIANRPLLLLGVLLVVLGVQAIALGLVGEIIVHINASRRPSYRLTEAPNS